MDKLDHRELTLIKRAAEDACSAMNRHYKPFIDAVAKPLTIIALVEMAQSRQAEIDALNNNHLAYIDKVIAMESDYLEKIEEKDKRINQALNFINNWWHPDLDQKLLVEALGRALRGEHE